MSSQPPDPSGTGSTGETSPVGRPEEPTSTTPSRRRFLGGAALGVAGVGAAGAAGFGIAHAVGATASTPAPASSTADEVAMYGQHQAGIATPAQDRLAFAAFDLTTVDPQAVMTLMGLWAAAAAQMTKGLPIGAVDVSPLAAPIDTGEAMGLAPAELTVTVGFGPTMFDDRFGLKDKRPAALVDLPPFPNIDHLESARTGGDLCVQACSNDPTVAFHVIRNFARLARGTAVMRWTQLGFGRTSTTSQSQSTPRNLMGFKDGTNNIREEDGVSMDDYVWAGEETDQAWMKNGSYLVARRIRMLIESWDTDDLSDQEQVFGRAKTSGAPLTGRAEFDPVELGAKKANGQTIIAPDAHIRLAAPATNAGQKILRRGYSYTDGIDSETGLLDAGLFFIAYQKDPRKQFIPIQNRLAASDALNEYIRHTGGGIFAVPPGLSAAGDWYGKQLFT
jgi:deferrochelatase/peroxidase EfeB